MSARLLTTTRSRLAFALGLVVAFSLLAPLPERADAFHGNCLLDVANEADAGSFGGVNDISSSDSDSHPVGQSHTMTAQLITTAGGAVLTCASASIITIDFERSGPNDAVSNGDFTADSSYTPSSPDATCTILPGNPTSSCTVGYTGLINGRDEIMGWIDHDGVQSTVEADQNEGVDEVFEPGTGGTNCTSVSPAAPEPDCTDVTETNWTLPGGFVTLDCDDSNPPDTERELNPSHAGSASSETYTCTSRGGAGQLTAGTGTTWKVYAEVENSVNDPDPSDGASYRSPDYSCDIVSTAGPSFGTCTIAIPQAEFEVGTAEICFWGHNTASPNSADPDLNNGPGVAGEQLCTGASSPPNPASDQTAEPTGEAQLANGSDPGNDLADQVELSWGTGSANQVDAEPESQANVLGTSATISAEIFDQFGIPMGNSNRIINFEFFDGSPTDRDGNSPQTPDASCTPGAASSCSITYSNTPPFAGTDLVCVYINSPPYPVMTGNNNGGNCDNEGINDDDDEIGISDSQGIDDDQDLVTVQWIDPNAATRLDCSPEIGTGLPGTSHTVNCSASNLNNQTVANQPLDFELTGANDTDNSNSPLSADFSCVTGGDGSCSITHGPSGTSQGGLTTYRAWIDSDNNNGTVEADMTEARDETVTPGLRAEADNTDVVDMNWGGQATSLTISPTSDTGVIGSCNPFTVTVSDASGVGLSGIVVDVEQRHDLANNTIANDEPIVGFCIPTTGEPNPSSVDPARGDLRQPDENPDNVGTSGGETVGTTDSTGKVTFGVSIAAGNGSDGTGNVAITAWTESTDNDDPDPGELQAVATKTWSLTTPSPSTSPTTSPSQPGPGTRTVSLSASTSRRKFRQTFSLNGVVAGTSAATPASCISNVSVTIQRDVLGGSTEYVDFSSATTTSSGAFSLNVKADKGANYIAKVVDGSPPGCLAATSTPEAVKVRVKMKLHASRVRISPGRRVTLKARVVPCEGHAGDQITLLRKNTGKGSFRKAATVSTNGRCVAKFKGRLKKTTRFKAKWFTQDEDHLSGKSRTVRVRVRRR